MSSRDWKTIIELLLKIKDEGIMRSEKKFVIAMTTILIVILIGLAGLLVYWRIYFVNGDEVAETFEEYKYHYVLITDDDNSIFWKDVYEGADSYGKNHDAYVEIMGEGLAASYSKDELAQIAILSKVDGIIIEGEENLQRINLINEAIKNDIPVITIVNDCYGSGRNSFVGIGNYNLGREYARAVIKSVNKNIKKVLILGDDSFDEATQNLLLNGFQETIQNEGNHFDFESEMITVNSEDTFASQEDIREILLNEDNIPDVIICVSENTTVNTYQALVDYNLVGKVKMIGYYMSDTTISAIDKGVIDSTIVLDANKMGEIAIKALNDYKMNGHVSDYITVEAKLVNKENIKEYLDDKDD